MEKTEYIGGDGFLPAPHKGTHVRLGLGAGGASCPGPSVLHRKSGTSVKRREAFPHIRLGV